MFKETYGEDEFKKMLITDIKMFEQIWPSTALGFGDFGGDSITHAITTIFEINNEYYFVFFNSGFAYCINKPNDLFFEDMKNRRLAPCDNANKYDK